MTLGIEWLFPLLLETMLQMLSCFGFFWSKKDNLYFGQYINKKDSTEASISGMAVIIYLVSGLSQPAIKLFPIMKQVVDKMRGRNFDLTKNSRKSMNAKANKKLSLQTAMNALLNAIPGLSNATLISFFKSPFAISILKDFEKFPSSIVGHPKLLNGLLHIENVRLKGFVIKTSSGLSLILFCASKRNSSSM